MRKSLFILTILSVLLSCNSKNKKNSIEKKTWIYLEIDSKRYSDSDAKYGEISLKDLNSIKENSKPEKLIMISNARYNDDSDGKVKDVSDIGNEKGTFFYRIKDISYLEILKRDPINTKVEILKEE